MERRQSGIALAAMVLANLIPLFGVLFLDWDIGALVVLKIGMDIMLHNHTHAARRQAVASAAPSNGSPGA